MKIGILGSRGFPYVYSGYETFVSELAVRLVARGHRVTVYCHRGLFVDRPRSVQGVDLVYVPAVESKILSQFTHSLISTIHAVGSDCDALLYVNSANGPFGLLTRLAHKRTAINVDGMEWARPKWKGIGARYFWWSSWLATKLFDEIITDSTGMADIYAREFHAHSRVIEYGADIVEGSPSHRVPPLGLVKDGYYLIVGRMIPDNNVLLLIEGFVESSSERKLVVLGDVPYRDAYADRVKSVRDPRVIFPGYIRDKRDLLDLYANCYCYLHGHEFGGTNPSLLKALGAGCCVAALDTVFSREVLKDDEHGFYFTKVPASIRDCIDALEGDPARVRQLRSVARTRITERYTWDRIVDEYERMLRDLVRS